MFRTVMKCSASNVFHEDRRGTLWKKDYTPYYEQCSLTTTTNHCRSHTLNRLQVIGHTLQTKDLSHPRQFPLRF